MSDALIPAALRQDVIGDGSFPTGTPIAVPSGDGAPSEMAVESLVRGDVVLTLSGPVSVRHVATRRLAAPVIGPDSPPRPRVIPVRVAAGAFGEGQPVAGLLLPPEQLVHVLDSALPGGVLVPVGALVNGDSIRREPQSAAKDWVRLELEQPGVVIAAGLLVAARLDPAFPPPAAILPAGPAMATLRTRLSRAAAPPPVPAAAPVLVPDSVAPPVADLPQAIAATPEAEPEAAPPPATLRVMAQGRALEPLADSTALAWHFMLPEDAVLVRLVSPPGVPADTAPAERARARRFGVAVRAILLDDAALALDGPAIGDGFHSRESAGSESWRWTMGDAVVHLPPGAARRRLTVEITDWHRLLQPV